MKRIGLVIVAFFTLSYISAQSIPAKSEVFKALTNVNDNWQKTHSPCVAPFWNYAVYQIGNMEAYKVTHREDYLYYASCWAAHNNWIGATSDNKAEWQLNYGEDSSHVLFGDWQVCFQVYSDLYNVDKDAKRIARAKEVMEYEMSLKRVDFWWWADGLFMVMPVMTKMYNITKNQLYLQKLYEYYRYAESIMYDNDEHLFYRDAKYVYPNHKSINDKKDFWARGNGWVLAALARVIDELPKTDVHRNYYITKYKLIAKAVIACQQKEGYWTRSMLDADCAPGYETSGTALFTFGLAWGLNHGLLDKATYLNPTLKAWYYLQNTAVQPDGSLGYVQPIGERAIPGQTLNSSSTADFGVGAFLLAASEMSRLK